ncbi:Imm49 family immunity protein [Tunturiibacter lichenicola]|uniref:Imm49 family immunity protein n=1 Tax=Tunturiibacter lichenicola TaxID=2051959 RepID=UPI003D9B136F
MNIPRHSFDVTRIERNWKSECELVPIKVDQTRSDAAALPDLIGARLRRAFLTAALQPESSDIERFFRDAAQCGAAAFVLARSDREVDLPLASDVAIRLRGPVPPYAFSTANWLSAVWCAMATNDFPSLMNLCYASPDLVRNSPNRDDDFSYLYVDASISPVSGRITGYPDR